MTLKEIFLSGLPLDDLEGSTPALLFQEVVAQMARKEAIAADQAAPLAEAFLEREKQGSTAFGGGFAMPHIFFEGLEGVTVAVARHPGGVNMEALDGKPSHVFVFLMGPEGERETYMKVVSHIASVARDRSWRKAIDQSLRSEDILELLADAVSA